MTSGQQRLLQAAVLAGGGALAAIGIAVANPTVRAEAHRLRRFARPLGVATYGVPVPPPLPPGRTVVVPERGELFIRDTGGDGPAVLLLHGWGATADVNFFNAYPALESSYRAVALDHRSHGRGLRAETAFTLEDCADDAAALVESLGLDKVIVVGYSMGGPVGLLLAHRHRDLVAGLVMAATALEFHSEFAERTLWRGLTVVEAGLRHGTGDGVVQRVLREAIEKEPSLDSYRAWIAGEFRRAHVEGIVEAGRALSLFDARDFATSLHLPAAVLLTTADRLVAPHKQRAVAEALKAPVLKLAADHDAPIIEGKAFGAVIRAAVDHVAGQVAV
jgi:pimeloyl-ACP methyl ester carboxylesterase